MAVFVGGLALAWHIQLFIVVVMMMMMGDDDEFIVLPTRPDCVVLFSSGRWTKINDIIVLLSLLVSIDLKISFLLLIFYE